MIKLIGLVVVAVGFALRVNTLLVIVGAGLVTGLVAGMSLHEVVTLTGRFFVDNRGLVLPVILMVPVVGILERHGLQERVATLIRRLAAATPGRVLWLYQAIRGGTSMLGLSIGNHASMVRPLVVPMAEAAARVEGDGDPGRGRRAEVRAQAAAAENVGNFFSDDVIVAVGALLLIKAFFDNAGVEVTLRDIKLWSLPTALVVLVIGGWRYRRLDRRLQAGRPVESNSARAASKEEKR